MGRMPLMEQGKAMPPRQTYSQVLRENTISAVDIPEMEIMKGKIKAMQAELKFVKEELSKVKILETKVASVVVSQVEESLVTLKTGQQTSNPKLDKICLILAKLLPNTNMEEMEVEQAGDETPSSQASTGTGTKTATANTRMVTTRSHKNDEPDPVSKKAKINTVSQIPLRK